MWLKTNLRLAQKLLHIRAKKIIFWNGLVNNAMAAIKKWKAAEIKNLDALQ
jgi:hypothetical protein